MKFFIIVLLSLASLNSFAEPSQKAIKSNANQQAKSAQIKSLPTVEGAITCQPKCKPGRFSKR